MSMLNIVNFAARGTTAV